MTTSTIIVTLIGVTNKGRQVYGPYVNGTYDAKTGVFTVKANSIKFQANPYAAKSPWTKVLHPELKLKNGEERQYTFMTQTRYFDSKAYRAKQEEVMGALIASQGGIATAIKQVRLHRQPFRVHETGSLTFKLSIKIA